MSKTNDLVNPLFPAVDNPTTSLSVFSVSSVVK